MLSFTQKQFFVILGHFLPFYPTDNLKDQNFEKMKKTPWDIIILHLCTIHDDHAMYSFWNIECDRQNVFSFWTFFALLQPRKWKFWKNEKIPGYIIILQKCIKNHDHMLCCSWDTVHDRCNFYFSFWAVFLPFYPPNSQKIKNLKNEKKQPWGYHHVTHEHQKLWSDDVWFLRYGVQQQDETEYNLELQGSVWNLQKRALFMKFYPEMPWNNTEMH